jgi:hypothetical protein
MSFCLRALHDRGLHALGADKAYRTISRQKSASRQFETAEAGGLAAFP